MLAARPRKRVRLLLDTLKQFNEDACLSMAAALAYYSVISLPGLLVMVITIAGLVFGPEAVRGELEGQIQSVVGDPGAAQIQTMIANASKPTSEGRFARLIGLGALLFGATGAFAQLQLALNRAWQVQPAKGGFVAFLHKRILSFGMVLAIAFLLLMSLALSALLSALGRWFGDYLPGNWSIEVLQWLNFALSYAVITLLFAAIYKILPDAEIAWRDVWTGALVTSLLFGIGKWAIGLYLGHSDVGSAYGAAGSLAIVLVWSYYSAVILFLGAEFTQVWAQRAGRRIEPSPGAVRIITTREPVADRTPGTNNVSQRNP